MKVLQSFWSKPFQSPHDESFDSRFMGGFPLKRHFIYTWALSILRLRDHFEYVHLVTDDFGKHLMMDVFQFPYTSCSTELENIKAIPAQFWCAGKLYVFSETNEEFIHFDGDVILGDLFNKNITHENVIAEYQYEDKPGMYNKVLSYIRSQSSNLNITPEIRQIITKENFIYNDYNLGIVGGKNYHFLNDYATESLKLIETNKNLITSEYLPTSFLNCFIDQFIFFNLSKSKNLKVSLCLKDKFNTNYDYQKHILHSLTTKFSFVHLHSTYKINYYQIPEKWLKFYYPHVYDKINMIIFGKKID
jgi:hypothetical protein